MPSVRVPIEQLIDAVRGRKVGVLTNGTVWLEEAAEDVAGVVRGEAQETVLLFGEHGVRGDEGASAPREPQAQPRPFTLTRTDC